MVTNQRVIRKYCQSLGRDWCHINSQEHIIWLFLRFFSLFETELRFQSLKEIRLSVDHHLNICANHDTQTLDFISYFAHSV